MADQNINNMTVTWNSGGTTFAAVKMNVTDTASAAASLLMDYQVGGSSKFSVRKDGKITGAGDLAIAGNATITGNVTITGTLSASGITGTVTGPASSTDNAIARFNGTSGGVIQNSGVIIDDNNNVAINTTGDSDKFGIFGVFNGSATTDGRYTSIVIGKSQSANECAHLGYVYDTTPGDRGAWLVNYGDNSLTGGIFVRSGGNVGIGTNSPTSKLVVQGNAVVNGTLTVTG